MIDLHARDVSARTTTTLWTLATVTLAFGLWWLRFDYTWAEGDQDEFVPYLLHLIDPTILSGDWFVQTQSEVLGVRTPFVLLLRGVSLVLAPQAAVGLVFCLSWLVICGSVYVITRTVGGSVGASVVSACTIMCLTPKWTLGGNDVVYSMLVPEMAAWAVALPALAAVLNRRWLLAGVLVGVSGWFQLLVGLHLLGIVSIVILAEPGSLRQRLIPFLKYSVVGTILLAPMLLVIAGQQFSDAAHGEEPTLTWILTHFRAPYHYLPTAFSIGSYAKFGLLVVLGSAALLGLRQNASEVLSRTQTIRVLVAIGAACVAALFFTEVVPVDIIGKLQLFKLTVVAKVLLVALVCTALGNAVTIWVTFFVGNIVQRLTMIVMIVVGATAFLIGGLPQLATSETTAVERWARDRTDRDAVFAIPPSNSSFRSRGRRPIVVNYAAVPFAPEHLREWYRRIRDVAPVTDPALGIALKAQLDSSFYSLSANTWDTLADKYSISYLVYRQQESSLYPLSVAFQDTTWVVYKLAKSGLDADSSSMQIAR